MKNDKSTATLLTVLVLIAQIILGATFIFSGFVKAVDPFGFVYKIQDYLTAFGLQSLHPLAFPAAIGLVTLEFLLGINMLLGMHVRTTYILTLLFMLVMTPLTLYLAIFDPVQDCGCFGDALIISNWETFWKNILLSGLAVFVFVFRKYVKSPYSDKIQWLTSFASIIFIIGISVIGIRHLPIFDFRPYSIGTNIPEAMTLPEGAAKDDYKSTYIYEKDGVQKEFESLEEIPINDSTWVFVDAKHELMKEGDKPPIHNFSMIDMETSDDVADHVLSFPDYSFLLISLDLQEANIHHIDQINDIYDYAVDHGYGFYCLTASDKEQIERWKNFSGAEYPFFNTDKTTLKTIIRSNPGLLLLKDGTIYNKWHYNDFPTETELNAPLEETIYGIIHYPDKKLRLVAISISFVLILLAVFGLDKIILAMSQRKSRRKDMNIWRAKKH
ncbi:MAG: DoxX family protein [Candidatus Azobacteroides sp.]|nr:DoxX family protein [Candidatus Azobacteroides sp.]